MIPILRECGWFGYIGITCLLVVTQLIDTSGNKCSKTEPKTGTVGTNVTLNTSPPPNNKGLLYWYKPNCTSNDRLCDYSGFTGTNAVSNRTNLKFTCMNNSTKLILINVTAHYSGQYCSRTITSNGSVDICFNVTIHLHTTPAPSPLPVPFQTIPGWNHHTTVLQIQIPSSGQPGNYESQQQDAAHIASILILLLLFIAIIILFFLKIPQKLWEKYHKGKRAPSA
ncbi:putative membrane glycoprotein UL9 [Cynomolgus macaque cytomegalovirus strain Ottawa]|uniref:Membrane glycoprotein UL9 n=1 Tax=macacine betaherpesvirus 8 TaxID=2560567 RepID=G8H123_9BETA|nr:putative membrane glycoprotein UL9 [Cynomolgus macaque cytomegalovirus strain Ottawa]AEQ32097.1 putative membrane glycoprotein UL9 [Cynomolgus macaque cytomegalovirus strain Ottawa]